MTRLCRSAGLLALLVLSAGCAETHLLAPSRSPRALPVPPERMSPAVQQVLLSSMAGGLIAYALHRSLDRRTARLERALPEARVAQAGAGIHLTFDAHLLFEIGQATLSSEATSALQRLAHQLIDDPQIHLLIVGHTDHTGPDAYNQALSEQRARATAVFLAAHGIADTRLSTVGYGETHPIAANETALGRQQNRRVEMALYLAPTAESRRGGW
ncbi:MAG: OmpA family protein [Bacteroidota bacterium]